MSNRKSDAPNDTRHVAEPAVSNRSDDAGVPRTPEDPDTRGDEPAPRELTGRAAGTDEDLSSLFANGSDEHLRDGFRSGNGDDPESDVERDDDLPQIDR
ncbi:MAG: hypothetical protein ABJB74_10165 [Gemmatimonas sp.]